MLSIKYHISLSTYALLENYFVNLLGRQSGKIKFLENYLSRARILSILPLHEYKFRQKAKLVLENYFLKLGIRRKQNVHECKFKSESKVAKLHLENYLESNVKREYFLPVSQCTARV